MKEIIVAAAPGLIELFGVVLAALLGWAANTARKRWGIEIEAKHREALHSALMTGAQLALKHELTGRTAIDLVLRYIASSVPGAIEGLKATPEVLTDLAKAKLEQAANQKVKEVTDGAIDKLADALKRAGAIPA